MEHPYGLHEEKVTDAPSYPIYCYNASAAVYLYNCLCINADSYATLIDASAHGYAMWLYSGCKRLDPVMLRIINTALEQRNVDLRVRLEPLVLVEGLGRKACVGNRHVMRIEPPGILDLAQAEDENSRHSDAFYACAARVLPRIAVWHMSYCDVDESYDLGYRNIAMRVDKYSCSIVRQGKTTLNIS